MQEAMRADPHGCRHLPKNFDNVHNLEFRKDAEGNPTKTAIGMYSGEHTLSLSCSLVGHVRQTAAQHCTSQLVPSPMRASLELCHTILGLCSLTREHVRADASQGPKIHVQQAQHCCCAGEGEYVAFANDCLCDGPVEIWLNRVSASPCSPCACCTHPVLLLSARGPACC